MGLSTERPTPKEQYNTGDNKIKNVCHQKLIEKTGKQDEGLSDLLL
jgi:hypothetical protein